MKPPNISLRQMRAFTSLARHGSFRAAASAFNLSQSGLSNAIRQMELQLGAALFDRTTRRVELTALGKRLLPEIERIVGELDTLLVDAHTAAEGLGGRVVVASIISVATQVLPLVVKRFQATHPHVTVQLLDFTASVVQEQLRSGKADIGVCARNELDGDMRFQFLAADPFLAIVPARHALARVREVAWESLARYPFIAMTAGTQIRTLIDSATQRRGIYLKPAHEASQPVTIEAMVAANLGISILPKAALTSGNKEIKVKRLAKPAVERRLGVVYRSGRVLSPAAAAFKLELVRYMIAHAER